jgi:hypothetical protein
MNTRSRSLSSLVSLPANLILSLGLLLSSLSLLRPART